MNGIIVVNKEAGYTSRDMVNKVSKLLKQKRIGHTGTLDPFATGVMVMCMGDYTKLAELITGYEKEYEAEIELGTSTDSLDLTGMIIEEKETNVTAEQIDYALKKMQKTYMQEVPLYSAVHKDGKRLYEYAREGKEVSLPKKEVTIKKIARISDVTYENNKTFFKIKVLVTKGTYIRSLVKDIAKELGTVGILIALNRTQQGEFRIEESNTLTDIQNKNYQLVDIKRVLKNYPKVIVSEELEYKIKNGSLLNNQYENVPVLFFNRQDELLALYKKYDKDPTKIKPWKTFF